MARRHEAELRRKGKRRRPQSSAGRKRPISAGAISSSPTCCSPTRMVKDLRDQQVETSDFGRACWTATIGRQSSAALARRGDPGAGPRRRPREWRNWGLWRAHRRNTGHRARLHPPVSDLAFQNFARSLLGPIGRRWTRCGTSVRPDRRWPRPAPARLGVECDRPTGDDSIWQTRCPATARSGWHPSALTIRAFDRARSHRMSFGTSRSDQTPLSPQLSGASSPVADPLRRRVFILADPSLL